MAIITTSSSVFHPSMASSSSSSSQRGIPKATINIPKRISNISIPSLGATKFQEQLSPLNVDKLIKLNNNNNNSNNDGRDQVAVAKLYAILEAVADRVEMHKNIGDQRDNWNTLLLNSINSLTLSAAIMSAVSSVAGGDGATGISLSSTIMYVAASGMLSMVNKIQPSQLAEEQRNAARLFKQIENEIKTILSTRDPTAYDVKQMIERVLALDRAYPLPLLGAMLEKFPAAVEPAVWWPERRRRRLTKENQGSNGWDPKLEQQMREIVNVIKRKDKQDYLRLGGKALKLNKILAVTAPALTGLAAVASAFVGSHHGGGWAAAVAVGGGALAAAVNAVEHGGQVGMVFEMYRSNAGFFKMVEEAIEGELEEEEVGRRENGEVMEMKVALQLGRSLSELRNLAEESSVKGDAIDEFASKLF